MTAQIAILLSTYNGARYLRAQIDSIIAQTNQDWILYLRDDGSKDETGAIIKEYQSRLPGKIHWLNEDHVVNRGVIGSFFELLLNVHADYYMFCDQDDVWLPEKIDLTLAKMWNLEGTYPERPVLVHTDLKVVDQDLQVQSPSMIATQALDPEPSFARLLVQNSVTGCTVMVNQALKQRVRPEDAELTRMHDWWLALIASGYGRMGFVTTPTILYRQHGSNTVGAKSMWREAFTRRRLYSKSKESVALTIAQAQRFERRFADLPADKREPLTFYTHLGEHSRLDRLRGLKRYGLAKSGGIRDVFFKVLIWQW